MGIFIKVKGQMNLLSFQNDYFKRIKYINFNKIKNKICLDPLLKSHAPNDGK